MWADENRKKGERVSNLPTEKCFLLIHQPCIDKNLWKINYFYLSLFTRFVDLGSENIQIVIFLPFCRNAPKCLKEFKAWKVPKVKGALECLFRSLSLLLSIDQPLNWDIFSLLFIRFQSSNGERMEREGKFTTRFIDPKSISFIEVVSWRSVVYSPECLVSASFHCV